MSNDTGGPSLYRLQRRISAEKVLGIVVQVRKWFRWRDLYHVDNEHRRAMIDVIEAVEKLQDGLHRVKLHSSDIEECNKKINSDVSTRDDIMFFAPGGNTSNRWRGPKAKPEGELPNRTDQYKDLVKRFNLERFIDGKSKPSHSGDVVGFYPDGEVPPDVDWVSEGVDVTRGWQLNRNQNRGRSNKNNQNQGNQNQSRS